MKTIEEPMNEYETVNEPTEGAMSDSEAEAAAGGYGSTISVDSILGAKADHTRTTYFVCTNENCSRWGVDSTHKSNEHPICPSCGQPLVVHQSGMVFVKHPTGSTGRKPPWFTKK